MEQRERVREKIRALLSKTTDRGCTEAEAMAAAEKAAKLMQEHGLSDHDVNFAEIGSKAKGKGRAFRSNIWSTIAYCTNTASLIQTGLRNSEVVFIGKEPRPEIADYLRRVCDNAIDREVRAFKQTTFYRRRRSLATKRQAVSDFTEALVSRLCQRLITLFKSTINANERSGADQALAERHSNLVVVSSHERKDVRYSEAYFAGQNAGDRVEISHGVNGKGTQPLIGGGAS
ncbi:MAG: DUF2786 domain-containing protein [Cohaesibacter sp.]|jgi:hypothetical protein|nr:DUF2786 domain-containing protein [Cohaesibacter sp.]